MSNSNYAELYNDDSESVTFAPVNGGDLTDDPFQNINSTGDMDPLHSADAARRLLGNDIESADEMQFPFGGTASGSAGNSSLLERIQLQKKQQTSSTPAPARPVHSNTMSDYAPAVSAPTPSSENQFGYLTTTDSTYYASAPSAPDPNNGNIPMRVPDYSASSSRPDPYGSSTTDYKDQMFNVLSAVGSAANSAAKSAYRGTKHLYGNVRNNRGTSGLSARERMAAMDYQRESLLMDPHDLEDHVAPTMGGASSAPIGLRAGIDGADSTVAREGYSIWGYAKQFLVDIKDIFLGAPRRTQIIIIAFVVFIVWLFISEELEN